MVGQFVHFLATIALEMITNMVADPSVWAFASAADASTHFNFIQTTFKIRYILNLTFHNKWSLVKKNPKRNQILVPMLDYRAWLCLKGNLSNLHLVLVPFFERHIVVNYVKLMLAILDAMYSSRCDKLISISYDGEKYND